LGSVEALDILLGGPHNTATEQCVVVRVPTGARRFARRLANDVSPFLGAMI
jgi:hypothetical protein